MVSKDEVEKQLKEIDFNVKGWGRAEVSELPHIILPDEQLYEAVNGIYEGGFALLLASNVRVLLVDKKPLNYLTVEDMRFDMITEIDYSHRIIGANITISAGDKHLKFMSYNQQRLRKLIGHVQHRMAASKQEESSHQVDQKQHLEQINKQLQAYLVAQHKHQEELYKQLREQSNGGKKAEIEPLPLPQLLEPSSQLKDYLYAQGLLEQHGGKSRPVIDIPELVAEAEEPAAPPPVAEAVAVQSDPVGSQMAEIYAEGMHEVFGKQGPPVTTDDQTAASQSTTGFKPLEINPLKIAYSKLPMALRNRKFGRPNLHPPAPGQTSQPLTATQR